MNTFNLTLDLNKSRAANPVRIRQGDVQGTTITALILDHGATADLSGYTAQFVMDLPDGTHYYRKAASLSGNVATVTIDETQAASVTGRTTLAYVQLLKGSTVKASTGCVTVEVLPDALDGKSVPESYDSAIQDAIDALDEAVEQLPSTVEDVLADHPEWTTTVQDGSITEPKLATDLARDRERLLYRLDNLLTAQLPEGETATATDAARTPMAALALYGRSTQDGTPTPSAPVPIVSVAPDSEGNISLLARGFNQWDEEWELGSLDSSGQPTTSTSSIRSKNFIPVLPSTAYYVAGLTGGELRPYYYDSAKAFVSRDYWAGGTANNPFTIPSTARYMKFAMASSYGATYKHDLCINISDPSRNGTYQPYESTVTPIPLDGHELRSLPDGTRDELTVDARGHAVLVQRVGSVDLGTLTWVASPTGTEGRQRFYTNGLTSLAMKASSNDSVAAARTPIYETLSYNALYNGSTSNVLAISISGVVSIVDTAYTDAAAFKAAMSGTELIYKLATPVTHDLGTIDPVPLVGPDLTAQAVPTAPFALTYERDLNVTLARLESAIAELATN